MIRPINTRTLIEQLVGALEELADLVEASLRGEYTPDSFTTQPARTAATEYLKQSQGEPILDASEPKPINVGTIAHIGNGRTTLTAAIASVIAKQAKEPAPKRPMNCGTGHCSCIECDLGPINSTEYPMTSQCMNVESSTTTEAYDDRCCVGMKPGRVMQRAHAMCPTHMPHVDRMAWMADYFLRNYINKPSVEGLQQELHIANTRIRALQKLAVDVEDAQEHLKHLCAALNSAYISSWQGTHGWQKELDAANEYLKDKP